MDDPTFRLRTVAEISAYLEDMVKGGAFAGFRVKESERSGAIRIHIRMKLSDYRNAVKRTLTRTVLRDTLVKHGLPTVEIKVGHAPIWMRKS